MVSLPNLPNLASVSQNKQGQKYFRCSWFSTEPAVHLRVVHLIQNFGSMPKIAIITTLFSTFYHFYQPLLRWRPPCREQYTVSLCRRQIANKNSNKLYLSPWGPPKRLESYPHSLSGCPGSFWVPSDPSEVTNHCITQQYTVCHNSAE